MCSHSIGIGSSNRGHALLREVQQQVLRISEVARYHVCQQIAAVSPARAATVATYSIHSHRSCLGWTVSQHCMQFVIPTFGENLANFGESLANYYALSSLGYNCQTVDSDNPAVCYDKINQLCAACSDSPHNDKSSH